jgi:chaperone modulatory protein CbpM
MANPKDPTEVRLLGESDWLAASDVCRLYLIDLTVIVELVDLGVISHRGVAPQEWQLPATALPRLRVASRLIRDLGVNATGAALAVELLEAQRELERRIGRLERLTHE